MQFEVEDNFAKCSPGRGEREIPVSRLPFFGVTAWPTLFAKAGKERLKSCANNHSTKQPRANKNLEIATPEQIINI